MIAVHGDSSCHVEADDRHLHPRHPPSPDNDAKHVHPTLPCTQGGLLKLSMDENGLKEMRDNMAAAAKIVKQHHEGGGGIEVG